MGRGHGAGPRRGPGEARGHKGERPSHAPRPARSPCPRAALIIIYAPERVRKRAVEAPPISDVKSHARPLAPV